jgi:ribonuclease Z
MMRFGLSYAKVKCIFVSHSHADHIVGIAGLAQTLDMVERKEPLLIFCPRGSRRHIEALLSIGAYCYEISITEVGEGKVFEGDGFTVSAFEVKHSRPTLGFIFKQNDRRNFDEEICRALGIKGRMFGELERKGEITVGGRRVRYEDVSTPKPGIKIVYAGDCLPSESTVIAAKDADLLIHEATYASDREKEAAENMHSTAAQAAEIALRAGAKRLVLVHLSGRYKTTEQHLKEARELFANSEVAEDGSEFCF